MSIHCKYYDPPDGIVFWRIAADGSFFTTTLKYLAASCPNTLERRASDGHGEVAFVKGPEALAEFALEVRASGLGVEQIAEAFTSNTSITPDQCVYTGWAVTFKQISWEFPFEGQGDFIDCGAKNGLGEECWLHYVYVMRGEQPTRQALSAELATDVLRAICWKESTFRQFDSTGRPLTRVNSNGSVDVGCMQVNNGTRSEGWNWRMNVARGREILAEKRGHAKTYLDKHGSYTAEMLEDEALQRYNGGRYHRWDETTKTWIPAPPNNYVESVRNIIASKPWGVVDIDIQRIECDLVVRPLQKPLLSSSALSPIRFIYRHDAGCVHGEWHLIGSDYGYYFEDHCNPSNPVMGQIWSEGTDPVTIQGTQFNGFRYRALDQRGEWNYFFGAELVMPANLFPVFVFRRGGWDEKYLVSAFYATRELAP